MTDALDLALNRFDVPPLSAGRIDRVVAAATGGSQPSPEPRRQFDRRGAWRRGRQVVIGGLAAGLLSAAAVASGLLGSVGIEVPVLTAMLAPKPEPVVKAQPARPPVRQARVQRDLPLTVPPVAEPAPAALLPRPLLPAERMALREERRERRQAFAAAHPVIAKRIEQRVRQQLRERALARRAALTNPAIDPALPGVRAIGPAERLGLARAARRDRLAAERMIDRRIRAREARMALRATPDGAVAAPPVTAAPDAAVPERRFAPLLTPEQRAARRARIQAMPPEQRAAMRERMQQRRALRLERQQWAGDAAN